MEIAMNTYYRTSDLYFAAYLKASQVPLVETERQRKKIVFVFDDSLNSVKDLKTQFFNRQAKIPALTFVDEIRAMKSLTHDVGDPYET